LRSFGAAHTSQTVYIELMFLSQALVPRKVLNGDKESACAVLINCFGAA
jgi:hypothetical protein